MSRIPVTILGATGVVGQRFVRRLMDHPLFEIRHLAASDRSTGKVYEDACAWRLDGEPYGGLRKETLRAAHPDEAMSPVVFSAPLMLKVRLMEANKMLPVTGSDMARASLLPLWSVTVMVPLLVTKV